MSIRIGRDGLVTTDDERPSDPSGTYLQGHLAASRSRLLDAFGPPTGSGDGSGHRGEEWVLEAPEGTVTVYAWFPDEMSETCPEPVSWHVGGLSRSAAAWAWTALGQEMPARPLAAGRR